MKKRVMCVHTELVREGSVLYEGKDGNTGITTTEEACLLYTSPSPRD